jgi:starch phosphorylase
MLIADFDSYINCHDRLYNAVSDKKGFARMSLANIAESGIFAADRAVGEYRKNIWRL